MNNPIIWAAVSGLVVFLAMGGLMLMTRNSETNEGAVAALQWFRHEFGKWFAGTSVLMLAWVVAIWAIWVGIHWDMGFAETMAPSPEDIPIYRQAGVVISLGCVLLLSLSTWSFRMKAKASGAVLALMWVASSVASYSHGVGETTRRFEDQYVVASAIEAAQDQPEESRAATEERLERNRTRIIADRDAEIAPLRSASEALQDDGVEGISTADSAAIRGYQDQINAIVEAYRPRIQAIDDQLISLATATSAPSQTDVVTTAQETQKFNALFATLAGRNASGEINEERALLIQKWYSIFWPMLVTALGVLPAVLLQLHWHAAKRRPEFRTSGDEVSYEIDGETLSEEEIKEAVEAKRRRQEAGQKAAETRKANAQREQVMAFLDADPWKVQMHDRIWGMHLSGMPASEIANSIGWTPQEFENNLRILFFPDQIEAINSVRKDGGSYDVAAE